MRERKGASPDLAHQSERNHRPPAQQAPACIATRDRTGPIANLFRLPTCVGLTLALRSRAFEATIDGSEMKKAPGELPALPGPMIRVPRRFPRPDSCHTEPSAEV